MTLDDPAFVREQYADESGLEARRSIYAGAEGPDAREVAFAAVAERSPARDLEVGCGPGELADRISRELAADVVAVDTSERMVALARARGVRALVGDVQALPFEDASFDCALAAWMLFHVPDLDRGLAELARVLQPGGRLVAVTNAAEHVAEIWNLVGVERVPLSFGRENGEELLRSHFASVERRDVDGRVKVRDSDAIRRYLASSSRGAEYVDAVPELEAPLVAGVRVTVFVAEKA